MAFSGHLEYERGTFYAPAGSAVQYDEYIYSDGIEGKFNFTYLNLH